LPVFNGDGLKAEEAVLGPELAEAGAEDGAGAADVPDGAAVADAELEELESSSSVSTFATSTPPKTLLGAEPLLPAAADL